LTEVPALADAYSAVAESWADGPTRIYGRLADLLVAASPIPVRDALVLDLGSGTGLGSRAAMAAGARVIAADIALGMLAAGRSERPPAAVADATTLPFAPRSFDVVLAPFSLNHLSDPSAGVREAGRVLRERGVLLASTYAADDDHPVKHAVDEALRERGWEPPTWYSEVKAAMASWGTVEAATQVIRGGGLTPIRVEKRSVSFGDLAPADLVAWRLGMAQSAPFVASLDPGARAEISARGLEVLGGDPPPLVRRVIFLAAA
jgi:SAM-dependent methyltransferase